MIKTVSISLALAALLMSGCSEKKEEESKPQATTEKVDNTAAESASEMQGIYGVSSKSVSEVPAGKIAPAQQTAAHTSVVSETMDAAGYTHVKVEEDGKSYWIAGPKTELKVGDKISYVEQMWMENFPSKSLNKTFDRIMFVSTIAPAGAAHAAAKAGDDCSDCDTHKQQAADKAAAGATAAPAKIVKAEGEYTVEDVYTKRADLSGKTITLKANVTKVSRGILGKDWIHLQDGSGADGTHDLVVTSPSANVEVGDTVTMEGLVETDVDFGAGYSYAVIVQEAKFTK